MPYLKNKLTNVLKANKKCINIFSQAKNSIGPKILGADFNFKAAF